MISKKNKISPKKYNEFIEGLTLQDITLVYSESKAEEGFSLPADITTEFSEDYKKLEKGGFIVIYEYKLKAIVKDKKKPGFHIHATYNLAYQSKVPINKEIFEIFSKISLPLHTWPYFRQFVQEMTLRMGLPPLILDILKFK